MTERQSEKFEKGPIPFNNRALCPIEHKLFGSTADVNGENIPLGYVENLLQGDVPWSRSDREKMFVPILIQEGTASIAEVQKMRAAERSKPSQFGALTIFDPRSFVRLQYDEFLEICLEPSDLDPVTGEIIPQWRIRFLHENGSIIKNPKEEWLDQLKIVDKYIGRFTFEKSDPKEGEGAYGILRLQIPIVEE